MGSKLRELTLLAVFCGCIGLALLLAIAGHVALFFIAVVVIAPLAGLTWSYLFQRGWVGGSGTLDLNRRKHGTDGDTHGEIGDEVGKSGT